MRARVWIALALAAAVFANAASAVTQQASGRWRTPAAVGALFTLSARGRLATHFCTASAVNSPNGNVIVTAAHCLLGETLSSIAFVPGYRSGLAPFGVWRVVRAYVDRRWTAKQDPITTSRSLSSGGRGRV